MDGQGRGLYMCPPYSGDVESWDLHKLEEFWGGDGLGLGAINM